MGRLPPLIRGALLAVALAALAGCGGDGEARKELPPPVDGRRSEVVAQKGGPATTATGKPTAAPTGAKPPREICTSAPVKDGAKLPDGELLRIEEGGAALPEVIPTGGGQWTWVNLWAGWCGPCKEEMPMLASWEATLKSRGKPTRFAFVSIDDDERQARRFLSSQKDVTRSWRLAEGEGRTKWLAALGLPESPELPVHLLFDAEGALRCVVMGAIARTDFARVEQIVSKR